MLFDKFPFSSSSPHITTSPLRQQLEGKKANSIPTDGFLKRDLVLNMVSLTTYYVQDWVLIFNNFLRAETKMLCMPCSRGGLIAKQ